MYLKKIKNNIILNKTWISVSFRKVYIDIPYCQPYFNLCAMEKYLSHKNAFRHMQETLLYIMIMYCYGTFLWIR